MFVVNRNTIEKMLSSLQNNKKIIIEMINIFIISSPDSISKIKNGINSKDLFTAGKLAHSLKSSGLYLGAEYFSELCLEIEKLRETTEFEKATSLLIELEKEYPKVVSELKKILDELSDNSKIVANPIDSEDEKKKSQ